MTEAVGDDRAKRARRNVERALGLIKPTTSTRKVLVTIAVPVAGVLTEQAVRALEQKGPELASRGVELAKEKLPVAAAVAKEKVNQLSLKIREWRRRGANGAA